VYLEGVDHARRLISGVRVAARMKPVVVLEGARHQDSGRAAATHTAALVGGDIVFDSVLPPRRVVQVTTLQELFSAAELVACGRRTQGDRLAITGLPN
jgi:acetyltransferase